MLPCLDSIHCPFLFLTLSPGFYSEEGVLRRVAVSVDLGLAGAYEDELLVGGDGVAVRVQLPLQLDEHTVYVCNLGIEYVCINKMRKS